MAPFFGSWEGRGTSRRTPPVIGSVEPASLEDEDISVDVADFEDVVDIDAAAGIVRRICDWKVGTAG